MILLREKIGKLLPFAWARDAPIGAEHKAGDAGQVEILPEQLSEVGSLSVYRQVGAVDHRQHLLTERADERGRRIIGRRWARRPEQAGNHRDGDGKAPAVSGTAAARGSPARRTDAPREATMQPAEYRKLDTPEAAVYVGLSASTLSKRRVFGNGPKYLPCLRRSRSRVLHQIAFCIRCGLRGRGSSGWPHGMPRSGLGGRGWSRPRPREVPPFRSPM